MEEKCELEMQSVPFTTGSYLMGGLSDGRPTISNISNTDNPSLSFLINDDQTSNLDNLDNLENSDVISSNNSDIHSSDSAFEGFQHSAADNSLMLLGSSENQQLTQVPHILSLEDIGTSDTDNSKTSEPMYQFIASPSLYMTNTDSGICLNFEYEFQDHQLVQVQPPIATYKNNDQITGINAFSSLSNGDNQSPTINSSNNNSQKSNSWDFR